ncbi:MAG: HAD-IA family hydrolase [Selenomonadaceae bacterium]|nr:HAD-IA family hydrolase [Selenomonadaceae bacterium]
MIKGVIFDIDGTLYSYTKNDKVAVQSLCDFAEKNLCVTSEDFLKAYYEARRIVKERLTDGGSRHSRVLFLQTTLELLEKNSFRHVCKMYDCYWDNFLAGMTAFEGATEFICKLKKSGIKIAVCTDMTAQIQYRKIQRLNLSNYIDFMVSSEETGLEKPARVMFELALKKLQVNANETAYFGDSLERDIAGAANVGIAPYWYIGEHGIENTEINCVKFRSYNEVINSKIFFAVKN